MKTGYEMIHEILTKKNVATIKNTIYQTSYKNLDIVAEGIIDLIAKNSNDFTKDIATRFQSGASMSEKQAWCLSYQIINNIEVYILANKEEENLSK